MYIPHTWEKCKTKLLLTTCVLHNLSFLGSETQNPTHENKLRYIYLRKYCQSNKAVVTFSFIL